MPADPQAAAREATRLVLIRCLRSLIGQLQRQLFDLSRTLARLERRE